MNNAEIITSATDIIRIQTESISGLRAENARLRAMADREWNAGYELGYAQGRHDTEEARRDV